MKFTALGEALRGIELTGSIGDPLSVLQSHWGEIVGVALAGHTYPRAFAGGELTIVASSNGWIANLAWLEEAILKQLGVHGYEVTRLIYRVGRIPSRKGRHERSLPGSPGSEPPQRREQRSPSKDANEALARLRAEIEADRRAKAALGWKACSRCGALIAPHAGTTCVLCTLAASEQRTRTVARLLFDEPWMSFERAHVAVTGLTREDFSSVRRELLRRWGDIVNRLTRGRGAPIAARERAIALAFVALKTGRVPDELAPATLRNEFGDELYARLFGTETTR
uniref:Uncharacterized protein n=1 Tax=mine drainage metagenome TaxID=410659 RepID=E6Q747_9ZZZZ